MQIRGGLSRNYVAGDHDILLGHLVIGLFVWFVNDPQIFPWALSHWAMDTSHTPRY